MDQKDKRQSEKRLTRTLEKKLRFNAFDQEEKKKKKMSMYCIVAFFQAVVAQQGFDFVRLFSKTEKDTTNSVSIVENGVRTILERVKQLKKQARVSRTGLGCLLRMGGQV